MERFSAESSCGSHVPTATPDTPHRAWQGRDTCVCRCCQHSHCQGCACVHSMLLKGVGFRPACKPEACMLCCSRQSWLSI